MAASAGPDVRNVCYKTEAAEIRFLRPVAGYRRKDQMRNGDIRRGINMFIHHHHHHWQNSPLEQQPSTEDSIRSHPVFTSFDIAT
jgi:hypothetical protein